MEIPAAIGGLILLAIVLVDAFNTIVLARRTEHIFRLARGYYEGSWAPWVVVARRIQSSRNREAFLGVFGPLSLLMLVAIWAVALIVAFGLLQWAAHMRPTTLRPTLANDFYLSAATLFTLTSGDPVNPASKILSVMEGGIGLGFLGLVVGYLPVFYQSFSARELRISLLDARGGSPPSAGALLQSMPLDPATLEHQLAEWEQWAAQVLENHMSFPMLAYFRSQHANQSWLTAMVAMIDCAAVVTLCSTGDLQRQAKLMVAMGRHVLSDMAVIFGLEKEAESFDQPETSRLTTEDFEGLLRVVDAAPDFFTKGALTEVKLRTRARLYEPQAMALGHHFLMALPSWMPDASSRGNWRVSLTERDEVPFAVSDPFAEDFDEPDRPE